MHTFGKHQRKFIHALITVMLILSNNSNIKYAKTRSVRRTAFGNNTLVCFCAYFDKMADRQIHQFRIGNGIKVDYMVDHKTNRMKTIDIERHHIGKSLKYNPINPNSKQKIISFTSISSSNSVFFIWNSRQRQRQSAKIRHSISLRASRQQQQQ